MKWLAAAVLAATLTAPTAARADAVDARTRTVEVSGRDIAYRSVGSGRPVVLVMGLGGTMDGWDPAFVDGLAAAGHRVVLVDNPGAGRTDALPGKLSIRKMADNVHRLVRALKLRRPDVAGWSMGGMIAQSYAVRHPRDLRRLVLLATAPGDGKATPPKPEALAVLVTTGEAATALDLIFPPAAKASRDGFLTRLARRRNGVFSPPEAVRDAQVAASADWLGGQDPDGRRVQRLRMPVLVGGGELDPLLPVANQRHLARTIRRSTQIIYADASHAFLVQRRRDFLPRLRRFLRSGG